MSMRWRRFMETLRLALLLSTLAGTWSQATQLGSTDALTVEEDPLAGPVLAVAGAGPVITNVEDGGPHDQELLCETFVRPLSAADLPRAEGAVQGSLIGTVDRGEGPPYQLTYADRPLYIALDGAYACFARHRTEVEPGWVMIGADGNTIELVLNRPERATEEDMRLGARVFSDHCARCHGADGDETIDPRASRLAASARAVERLDRVLRQLIQGGSFMPGFGDQLTNEELAAVATYIRNSWGHSFSPVTPEQVSDARTP